MSNLTHWRASPVDGHVRDQNGALVLRLPRHQSLDISRLAAAAPDMLETLRTSLGNVRSLAAALGDRHSFGPWIEELERTIAKAEGHLTAI